MQEQVGMHKCDPESLPPLARVLPPNGDGRILLEVFYRVATLIHPSTNKGERILQNRIRGRPRLPTILPSYRPGIARTS